MRCAVNAQEHEVSVEEKTETGSWEYDVSFSLPNDKFNARGPGGKGKVYGVCTLVRRDVSVRGKLRTVEWDREGRVLVLELPFRISDIDKTAGKGLAIFNIYAVNGTTFAYRDHNTGTIMGDRHAFKRRFHTLLRDEVARYHEQGWEVVVAGDLNISRGPLDSFPAQRMGAEHVTSRRDFEEKFMSSADEGDGVCDGGLGMKDTFREIRGLERKFTYRPPGRKWGDGMDRVDLILASGGMVGTGEREGKEGGWSLVDADILDTELDRGPSDHVPLYVDIAPSIRCEKDRRGS